MTRPRSDFGETRTDAPFRLKRRLWASIELDDNYEGVKKALDDGTPVDSKDEDGRTPLAYVLRYRKKNWPRVAGLLISRAADVRLKCGKGKHKETALDILIQINDEEALDVIEQYVTGVLTA